MGKYERIQRRREEKEARRDRNKVHEKEVKRIEAEKKMTTWRRDQHGNFIFRGAFKISPLAAIVLIAFIAIAVFFAVAVLSNTEESGECANPFCHMLGIEDDDPDRYKFAPPTSGTSEERELP
tara:strand:+ start:474 stop:842 length:369 start_codon:yes stop_codon:yes gene_type:complete